MVSSILCFGLTREFLFIWVLVGAAIPYGILIISLVLFSFRYDRQHTQDKYSNGRQRITAACLYGDNVFEKDGIRRDRTGDGEKTRCLCGKRGIFNRDGPAMGPQIIRQLE